MNGRIRMAACLLMAASPAIAQESLLTPPALQNPGFEAPSTPADADTGAPESWMSFSSKPGAGIGVTPAVKRSGEQSLTLKAPDLDNGFSGVAQPFASVPGYHYVFAANVIGDATNRLAGEAYGQIHFEWRDAQGKEISRTWGPQWKADLATRRWERFCVEADAPKDAASGIAVITFYSKNAGGRGSFYVDDCEFSGGLRVSSSPRRGPTNSSSRARHPMTLP
jgi:hypothetical protein